ncbi:hypothetical protein AB0A77_36245 [Streptomyces varsoviensis]|uniref:hypothetical protein n=1 Tax=Streptomyces varsoviensis TaxID=67373 RepID=UPI0033CE5565
MTTDLGLLTTAAAKWDAMAGELKKVASRYGDTVQKITMGQGWEGISAGAAHTNFVATRYEYSAAQVQARAIASLLRDAHEQFTELKKKVENARDDAIAAGMTVSEAGRVTFDYSRLTPAERSAYYHDPDGQASVRSAVTKWQQHIDDRVKAISETDQHVKIALSAAVVDSNKDAFGRGNDETLHGFNAYPESNLAKAGIPAPCETATRTSGWTTDGTATATGPDAGVSATGPAYGKEGMLKAYADLGHATAQGSLTDGSMKLSGIADANAGARASASAGITDKGVSGAAEVSAGGRAMAEGRAEYGHVGVYERATGFAGGEGQLSAGVGPEGLKVGAKAFAGAKVSGTSGAEVAGIGVGGTAEGWAGAGAEAKWTFGKGDDGKFHIGGKVGISPALGGSVGLEITVDPGKVVDAVNDAVDAVGDAADAVGDFAGSVKDTITSYF